MKHCFHGKGEMNISKMLNLVGNRYGKLVVKSRAPNKILPSGYSVVMWNCKCDCGNETIVPTKNLIREKYPTRSCGCGMYQIKNNLVGQKFGRLLVIEKVKGKILNSGYEQQTYKCACECGKNVIVSYSQLKTGNTRSCGCLQKELTSKRTKTHGMSKTKIYNVWKEMRYRCFNPKDKSYKFYGALGITVCDEWNKSFDNFYAWAKENGYKEGLEIDRIDGNKGYDPDNCRFSNRIEQMNNIKTNKYICINNIKHTAAEWSRISGTNVDTIYNRLKLGWDDVSAVFAPRLYQYSKLGGISVDRELLQKVVGDWSQ